MSKRIAGPEIERLIQLLAKVPGLGPRSARRAALHLIKKKEQLLAPLASAMARGGREGAHLLDLRQCRHDRSLHDLHRSAPRRQPTIIVVEDVADLWALERAGALNARFHVLGGTLSPLDGIGPDAAQHQGGWSSGSRQGEVQEIILAVNATVEGQTTAHYLTDQLSGFDVKVTRLAHGVPVGGELDYLDEGTLAAALKSRTVF